MKRIIARLISIIPALFLQYIWYKFLFSIYTGNQTVLEVILLLLSFIVVLYIICKRWEASYKIFWLIIILIFPVFGTWFYLTYGNRKTVKPLINKIDEIKPGLNFKHNTNEEIINDLKKDNKKYYQLLNLVSNKAGFPINKVDTTKYYSFGEDLYEDMLKELKKAEKFIYIEYFIISNGKLWDSIIDILEEKANNGVDVRVLFDDFGSISTYGDNDIKKLKKLKIKVTKFNPIMFVTGTLNNRDHRKMTIIDNKVAFSGGINLADEYINHTHRFGVWKDIGFKITGSAVSSYTYMFTEFWNAFSKNKIDKTIETNKNTHDSKGYILSYYDSPSNIDSISNNLYIELLESSTDYMYFYTPYLILGEDLINALIRASIRGVDVRIIMPGIPDKKIIYRMSRSYYDVLLDAGVKIYEYEKGFVHAKATISDDKICTIGTVNLDYRSLFLHFENNTIFYKDDIIKDLKKDYMDTINESRLVVRKKKSIKNKLIDAILRLIAPLC